ncbi:alpha/beta-hydrolase [Gloeophyllum trabeum ATCC 11539]|uniref:Alpha/beta-hydrolase n=1 Tax=Gloeophyllum trabeum (strain ATCC 11539 / FP-39264 / Madison 617) TaxID=670483 RepID=S7PWJ0_GLOTA|nr:alpha/beta-hydrolase [Gloeophyllum trabeum ATCC 11539]EPQ51732.1 alpha/beta-hydrolase [Gloeophyllum trabeum ATCC 11539]
MPMLRLPSGADVYAEVHEATAPPSGPPVLLIHGLFSSTKLWTPITAALPARTRIAYDYYGHGRTPVSRDAPTTAFLASQIPQILAQLGLDETQQVDVVAHSGGCLIAMHFAAEYPAAVRRLVLLGHAPVPPRRERENAALIREKGLGALVDVSKDWLGQRARDDPAVLARIDEEKTAHDAEGVARVCEERVSFEWRVWPADTVVVFGREDPLRRFSQNVYDALKAREGRKVKWVDVDTGHHYMFEDPEGIGRVVRDALEDEL